MDNIRYEELIRNHQEKILNDNNEIYAMNSRLYHFMNILPLPIFSKFHSSQVIILPF